MTFDLIDILIPLLTGFALLLAMVKNQSLNKWAPVVGLISQPLWFYETIQAGTTGLLINTIIFTLIYAYGFYEHWLKSEQTHKY